MTLTEATVLRVPRFDWDAPAGETLLHRIAELGDHAMRLNVAASPYLTRKITTTLLSLGDSEIDGVLRNNPAASVAARRAANRPKRTASIVLRRFRKAGAAHVR